MHGVHSVNPVRSCYDCGARVPADYLACPDCGSCNLTIGRGRPTRIVDQQAHAIDLPYPWDALGIWPDQTLIALVGPPGSGKSTLAAALDPDLWITTEQTIRLAAIMMDRTGADPEIVEIDGVTMPDPPPVDTRSSTPEQPDGPTSVDTSPSTLGEADGPVSRRATLPEAVGEASGVVVVDSITEVGHHDEALEGVRWLRQWVDAAPDRRAVVVVGVNAAGRAAGRKAIIHLVDQYVFVRPSEDGSRSFDIQKNRSGPEDNVYFRINAAGVVRPRFPYAYSVEGSPGSYSLVAYPDKRAKWQGVIEQRVKQKQPIRGVAGAGTVVPGYPFDLLQPSDVESRRRFAELHGLKWINPDEVEE